MKKILWIDFHYQTDENILKLLLNSMKKKKTNKNYNNNILILLEYTIIFESINESNTNKNATKECRKMTFNSLNIKNTSEMWPIQYYIHFLKMNGLYKLNENISWCNSELILKNYLNRLGYQNLKIKAMIDISSDYEKTLWCWSHRLKQALELKNSSSIPMNFQANTIYLTYLLQTLALFQHQKLKRYQLLLSY